MIVIIIGPLDKVS